MRTFNSGGSLTIGMFSPLLLRWNMEACIKHGAGELRILYPAGIRKSSECHNEGSLSRRDFKAHAHRNTLLQQSYTYFNKVVSPNHATTFRDIFLANHHIQDSKTVWNNKRTAEGIISPISRV